MPRLIWTPRAAASLKSVYGFLAEKNGEAAAKAMDAIRQGVNILKQFPNAGRPADDLEPEHRELLVPFGGSGYAVFYEVVQDAVHILAVKHQKEAGY
jgi:toxin ParE1/3/4